MNTPNKLTVLRMALIPLFLVFMLIQYIPHRFLCALIIFVIASFTDFLDGYIARKQNLVTNFGKLMDPLADKLLVFSALLCFVRSGYASAVAVFAILAREFLVTSVRMLALEKGIVIAADIWGKVKTVLQMTWIIYALLIQWYFESLVTAGSWFTWPYQLNNILQWVVVALTIFSGFNYISKNKNLFLNDK